MWFFNSEKRKRRRHIGEYCDHCCKILSTSDNPSELYSYNVKEYRQSKDMTERMGKLVAEDDRYDVWLAVHSSGADCAYQRSRGSVADYCLYIEIKANKNNRVYYANMRHGDRVQTPWSGYRLLYKL